MIGEDYRSKNSLVISSSGSSLSCIKRNAQDVLSLIHHISPYNTAISLLALAAQLLESMP